MDNFDQYNVLLAIATNKHVLLMTGFVVQGHICWFDAQETFLIILIINVENRCAAWHLCRNHNIFFQDSLINRNFKRTAFLEIELFCDIVNVFTVTFHLSNVSLLNKFSFKISYLLNK